MFVSCSRISVLLLSRTYIFTLDSLGGKHPQAISKLAKYLAAQARDKRSIDIDTSIKGYVSGKSVMVSLDFSAMSFMPNGCHDPGPRAAQLLRLRDLPATFRKDVFGETRTPLPHHYGTLVLFCPGPVIS